MTTAIATQIRARLDAIAAERADLDEEERRLKKALEALEPTTAATPEAPVLDAIGRERLRKAVDHHFGGIKPVVDIEIVRRNPSGDTASPAMPYPGPALSVPASASSWVRHQRHAG